MADHEGTKVDGDQIMYTVAQGLRWGGATARRRGEDADEQYGAGVGAQAAWHSTGEVGDRCVLEKLREKAGASARKTLVTLFCWIKRPLATTAIVAGLQVLAAMRVRNHMVCTICAAV